MYPEWFSGVLVLDELRTNKHLIPGLIDSICEIRTTYGIQAGARWREERSAYSNIFGSRYIGRIISNRGADNCIFRVVYMRNIARRGVYSGFSKPDEASCCRRGGLDFGFSKGGRYKT